MLLPSYGIAVKRKKCPFHSIWVSGNRAARLLDRILYGLQGHRLLLMRVPHAAQEHLSGWQQS